MVETLVVGLVIAGGIALLGRRQPSTSGVWSRSLHPTADRTEASSDLPCPWCRSATRESDTHCPSCRQPFG